MSDVMPTDLQFAAEAAPVLADPRSWKILIADDEAEVHRVTKLALAGATFHGRSVRFLDAFSGPEAVKQLRDHPDIALVLMDVVMESEHAGLEAIDVIRRHLANPFVRIVLRTGQPGQAPERDVVERYDIDDYTEKTELTAKKLFTVVHTSLAHYRQLRALERSQHGLRRVIDATATVCQHPSLARMADAMLEQVAAMLSSGSQDVPRAAGFAAMTQGDDTLRVLAGIGPYAACGGQPAEAIVDPAARRLIEQARRDRTHVHGDRHFVAYFHSRNGSDSVVFLSSPAPIETEDRDLVNLFCRSIAIALENRRLEEQRERAQGEMVVALSEAIEARSRETGNHVRRVAEYARLLAQLSGLGDDTAHLLYLAAPLHDAGKIGIPDAILQKPGAHTEAEARIMRSHAELGRQIFAERDSPVLRAAAIVAGEHHERWDGMGYPNGFRGEQIHIFGRITALADVFDALMHQRCYKEAWPLRRTLHYLTEERGRRFDPDLIDVFMQNLDRFIEIHQRYGDAGSPPLVH